MQALLSEIDQLQLAELDEDWVKGIYHSEFLEIPDFPTEYETHLESVNITSVFNHIMKAIDSWMADESLSEEEKTWAALSHKVKYENMLTLLAYYIDYGTKNVSTKEYRRNALLASRVYYKLLSIPGFKAYHIYHSQLFANSLGCLNYPRAMCESDDGNLGSKELARQVNSVIKELRAFVSDLRSVIVKLQLQPSDMNFEDILSNLVDITGGAIVNKLNIDKIELASISQVIYEMIDILLQEPNGEPSDVAIRLLFKCLLPKLVAASADCRNANNLVRASYVTYSGLLLSKYSRAAVPSFNILLQHLCYTLDGLERAEVRQARVSLVVGLMSLLPRKSYKSTIKWLVQLCATAKVSHRQIGLEVLSKLLENEPDENEPPAVVAPNPAEPSPDNPANPEAKEGEQPPEGEKAGDQENPDALNKSQDSGVMDTSCPTEDESSQELPNEKAEEGGEEEIAGLLRMRPHSVPFGEILRAVYSRASDASGSLRARALAVLGIATRNTHPAVLRAIKELDSDSTGNCGRLLALAAKAAGDERAVVRRAAVTLLQRLTAKAPHAHSLAMLVNLCRDASVIVRSAAISGVGEMALECRDTSSLDAFLAGPVHQLSDPETKVQEQVTSFIQQMLFDRLKKFDKFNEDLLPWKLLEAINRNNMRRHLMKACALLAKSNSCVSVRVIDILTTHLASEDVSRQLQSLLLMSCVARHVDYSEVDFIVEYYYKITKDEKPDAPLLSLTLQLLMEWSQWIVGDVRAVLRSHLVLALTAGKDACRIECALLASHLDQLNLVWANELLTLYERRAVSGTDGEAIESCICAADLSLVAPHPPSSALTKHLLGMLQPLPELGPDLTEEEARNRAYAMVALGRLSIRSRDAAASTAPLAAALLTSSRDQITARLNALHALSDMCSRYTCIVEPLLDSICGCLDKESPIELRKAAARSITKLLLGAYLRLRTPFYYRYCALLADPEPEVREPAEYYVTWCMSSDTIYQHLVDSVLHYNQHYADNLTFDERQLIYDVMLQRMTLVQKLNVQCRLAREIIGHAADVCEDGEELSPGLNAALLDTTTLLCGPRMKLPRKPQNATDAADMDDLQERITTNIVSHKMKRTVAEVLVPAVLRLYSHMKSQGGQLAAYLIKLTNDLLKDYRQEIEELIENDEELIDGIRHFQENIGEKPTFGNTRNLMTHNAPPEPDTPRLNKRRRRATPRGTPAKRALKV